MTKDLNLEYIKKLRIQGAPGWDSRLSGCLLAFGSGRNIKVVRSSLM